MARSWTGGEWRSPLGLIAWLLLGVLVWGLAGGGAALYYIYERPVRQVRHCTLLPDPARSA
jgi:hypothetical protein